MTIIWQGQEALSPFRLEAMAKSLSERLPARKGIKVESRFIYLLDAAEALTDDETARAARLLDATPAPPPAGGFFVTPRKGTISPWSTKASQIFQISGIAKVKRVERGIRYVVTDATGAEISADDLAAARAAVFDRMAEALHVNREGRAWHAFAILRTFIVVTIGRYFDCMPVVGDALICLRNTFANFMPVPWGQMLEALGFTKGLIPGRVLLCIAVVLVIDYLYEKGMDVRERFLALPAPVRFIVYLVLGFFVVSSLNHVSEVGGGFMFGNF